MNLKSFIQNLCLFAATCAFLFILLEICFRFLPVYEGFNFSAVNKQQPVFHASPNRTVKRSKDWDFKFARDIRINNFGFRNDQDYTTDSTKPLIASIGDSYVEAVQVDYQDTFYGRLAQKLEGQTRVYSFGFSGAPLSQYLVWSKYATQEFKADYLNFTIISNDFDESLAWYGLSDGFQFYKECEKKTYCLFLNDYEPSPLRTIAGISALGRYLLFNLQAASLIDKVKQRWTTKEGSNSSATYVANVKEKVSDKRLEDSKKAVDFFFRDLPSYSGLVPNKITFIIDGRPYDMTEERFENSYFGKMRNHFIKVAKRKGYNIIDMKPVFSNHYSKHKQRFEFKTDGHWNALAHQLVSEELEKHYKNIGL